MRTLILVDIQKDFLPGGALAVPRGNEVVPVANRLQPGFKLVVATQDWPSRRSRELRLHPPRAEAGELAELAAFPQVLWPDHCVQGSAGAAFAPGLEMNRVETIFRKGPIPHRQLQRVLRQRAPQIDRPGRLPEGTRATAIYVPPASPPTSA